MDLLKEKFIEVIKTITPLITAVCILQFTLVWADMEVFIQFLIGSVFSIAGLILFFLGIDIGILPMGRLIGADLPKRGSLWLIAGVAFLMGFAVTISEPDVLVLAAQVGRISEGSVSNVKILYVIAVGVGIFVSVAMLRIILGIRMAYLVFAIYLAIIFLSFFVPEDFIPLAYDSGSVTTGALTAPVIISLALGLSSVLAGKSSISDGFGLLGIGSAGPIIAVMIMGLIAG